MRVRVLVLSLVVLLLVVSVALGAPKPRPSSGPTALILYDTTGPYGWIGEIHARMLANLLGHFPITYQAMPVGKYSRGLIGLYGATFYIGSTYDSSLPAAFASDVMTSNKPVCWFKYNIWQLAWNDSRFPSRFGFTFNWLDWTGYDTVYYQGQTFGKYQADPELGLVWILYPSVCSEVATACRKTGPDTEECIPYIVHGRNLWYVADLPFSYVSEDGRYLVFCDLLHDILGIDHAASKRALLRIEDVDTTADPDRLREIADYLHSEHVPFAVSVIPSYADPFGVYNQGVAEYDRLSWEPELVDALKYMVRQGGSIVLHGYSHQYDSTANPFDGVTGDDFEFYRVQFDAQGKSLYNGPVPEDSKGWAGGRVAAGLKELRACGLEPVAWETPHYAASAVDYRVFASKFPITTQRVLYFQVAVKPGGFKGTGHPDPAYFGGQFFPYVIQQDVYGQKVIPENLGSYEPDPWEGYRQWLVPDILRAADKNLAVRDGWAGFYFHPFYDLPYLQELVQGIKARGYTFVPLTADLK